MLTLSLIREIPGSDEGCDGDFILDPRDSRFRWRDILGVKERFGKKEVSSMPMKFVSDDTGKVIWPMVMGWIGDRSHVCISADTNTVATSLSASLSASLPGTLPTFELSDPKSSVTGYNDDSALIREKIV